MTTSSHGEALSYVEALRGIIERHVPGDGYSVKLEEGSVKAAVGQRTFSFPVVFLNNQDLGELSLALEEAENRGDDPVEELALQLSYLSDRNGS